MFYVEWRLVRYTVCSICILFLRATEPKMKTEVTPQAGSVVI